MKKILILFLCSFLTSCYQRQNVENDFIDKVLDLATGTSSEEYTGEEYVQFTNLYDTLTHNIPDDKDEKIILVERLKKRGFEITNYGRGNFPPLGPRIVIVELKKGNCSCEVSKMYYATVHEDLYQMAEGINCKHIENSEGPIDNK